MRWMEGGWLRGPETNALKTKPYHPSNCEEELAFSGRKFWALSGSTNPTWKMLFITELLAIDGSPRPSHDIRLIVEYPTHQRITGASTLNPGQSARQALGRIPSPRLMEVLASWRRLVLKESPYGFTHFLTENLYPTGMPSTCRASTRTTSLMISFECFSQSNPRAAGSVASGTTGRERRESSDEQTNDAWLMLLFSGWYVVLFTVEASEGKPLAGRTDMNVRVSRFTASSEKRSIQVFPLLGMGFPERGIRRARAVQ
ncbi:hypothetical protein BGY98DRAFT_930539 [Russula aff. rugulosa BPL654]|nr:hypothetical protein BGY98DRAFT_930539 [Russula aff. rugulosa BPL654]